MKNLILLAMLVLGTGLAQAQKFRIAAYGDTEITVLPGDEIHFEYEGDGTVKRTDKKLNVYGDITGTLTLPLNMLKKIKTRGDVVINAGTYYTASLKVNVFGDGELTVYTDNLQQMIIGDGEVTNMKKRKL